jgi:hypothetical protein
MSNSIYKATVKFVSNVRRETVGCIEYESGSLGGDILKSIYNCLEEAKHPVMSHGSLYINVDGEWTVLTADTVLPYADTEILYSEVIALSNAAEYDRVNGVVFFFHTNEGNHLYSPHIHAKYGEHEMKIHLISFTCIGDLENKQKTKFAVCYAKKNQSALLSEWHRIVG